jgi:hypothetical protein
MNSKKTTDQLLDKIIDANSAILDDKGSDAKTKFSAQDRILKALAIKEKQGKKSGRKFDLT